MDQLFSEFSSTLYAFVKDLNRYNPTEGSQKFLEHFEQLEWSSVIYRYYTTMEQYSEKIAAGDDSFIESGVVLLPGIDLTSQWQLLTTARKSKLMGYLQIMSMTCAMIMNETLEQENDSVMSVKNKNTFSVESLVGDSTTYETDHDVGVGSIAKMMNIESMIDMDKLKEELKSLHENPEKMQEAKDNLKEKFGGKLDDQTLNAMTGLVDDISKEVLASDIAEGDIYENLDTIASKLANNMGDNQSFMNIDPRGLLEAAKEMSQQVKNDTGEPVFQGGSNPFDMVEGLLNDMETGNFDPMKMMAQVMEMQNSMGGKGAGKKKRKRGPKK